MDTRIAQVVAAPPQAMFRLAASVEDWPRWLPHYRWVRVLSSDAQRLTRTVEMAARRDVVGQLGVPLRWTAVQTLHPDQPAVEFRHIGGLTRGMWVAWSFRQLTDNRDVRTLVEIRHVFAPNWPVPEVVLQAIVGEYFVNGVARRTLAALGQRAERRS